MIVHRSQEAIAHRFWSDTGLTDFFPRDIEKAVALKLPLAVVKLPRVTVPLIRRWLQLRHVRAVVPEDLRDLMGCLVAYRGFGVAFISGADPDDEQRLTVAHETAHFLHDYLLPREQLISALGDDITTVLDGKRLPTAIERANAVLAHVRLGPHVHLLPRNANAVQEDTAVMSVEDRADGLGLELVAPREEIANVLRTFTDRSIDEVCDTLAARFGLPRQVFHHMIRRPDSKRVISFLDDIRPALRVAGKGTL
jgi:Zn-dependent peptidase ImmA (M78 family)